MKNSFYIKEGLEECNSECSKYNWYPISNISKDYIEYKPYLYMNELDFFNKEHQSKYSINMKITKGAIF